MKTDAEWLERWYVVRDQCSGDWRSAVLIFSRERAEEMREEIVAALQRSAYTKWPADVAREVARPAHPQSELEVLRAAMEECDRACRAFFKDTSKPYNPDEWEALRGAELGHVRDAVRRALAWRAK